MRSRILSLIFCILAFSLTMVFVVNIINPASVPGPGETQQTLPVQSQESTRPEQPNQSTPRPAVTLQTVNATARELEAFVQRLAYGADKSYAQQLGELSTKLQESAAFLRDSLSDTTGSAYLTVLGNLLNDVKTNPFTDNSSFSVRMAKILRDVEMATPAQSTNGQATYPQLNTDPNGSLSLAMLSIYRQQATKPGSLTVTLGGQVTLGDAVLNVNAPFEALFNANENYPLGGVSALLATDGLTLTGFGNALTDLTNPADPLSAVKGKAAYAAALKACGVEAVLLNGKHLNDYGTQGLSDTQAALTGQGVAGLTVGQSQTLNTAIGKVCVLTYDLSGAKTALTQAPKADIAAAKAEGAKLVIVAFTRTTSDTEPNAVDSVMTQSARKAVDNGADLVVNYSQSVIQAIDVYKDRYIVYSPAVLYASADKDSRDNGQSFLFQQTFTLAADGSVSASKLSVTPVNNGSATGAAPTLLLDAQAQEVIDQIAKYSNNTKYTRYGIKKENIDFICIQK